MSDSAMAALNVARDLASKSAGISPNEKAQTWALISIADSLTDLVYEVNELRATVRRSR